VPEHKKRRHRSAILRILDVTKHSDQRKFAVRDIYHCRAQNKVVIFFATAKRQGLGESVPRDSLN
jgi:hypothetical protein